MADYEFLTTFAVRAPREVVFDVVADPGRWMVAWPGVREVAVTEAGDAHGLGRTTHLSLRAPFGYTMTMDLRAAAIDRPRSAVWAASGDVDGEGVWRLSERDGETCVSYRWRVRTTKAWMNALAPVARPAFEYNHARAMRRGMETLAASVGSPLLRFRSGGSRPAGRRAAAAA